MKIVLHILTLVTAVVLCAPGNALETTKPAAVSLQISGIVCRAQRDMFYRARDRKPVIYVRADQPGREMHLIKAALVEDQTADVAARVMLAPGNYSFAIQWPFGGSTFSTSLMSGHPRHVTLSVCNAITFRDSNRSVFGTLPSGGFAALIRTRDGDLPAFVDGDAFYANNVPDGKLTLRLFFPPDGRLYCDLDVSDGSKDWQYEHIRFNIDAKDLASKASCESRR